MCNIYYTLDKVIWISSQRSKNITKNNQNLQARGNVYYSENTIGYKKNQFLLGCTPSN